MKTLGIVFSTLMVVSFAMPRSASAQVSDELESLGSHQSIQKRANLLENRTRIGVVQGRAVSRDSRFEIGVNYGPTAYGDSYLATQNAGVRADFHINPRWSVGVQYVQAMNSLTSEAKQRFDTARVDKTATIPQVAYPEQSVMALVNWYMTYGKINVFDWTTVQFDIYSLLGVGQVSVSTDLYGQTFTENSNIWTAGLGVGFWLTQNITMRPEVRYQNYTDKVYTGTRNQNQAVATIGFGVLL